MTSQDASSLDATVVHPASAPGTSAPVASSAAARTSLVGTPRGTMVLRVHGAGYDDQELRVLTPKCSIGASDECTIQVHGEQIAQLHCLILRGSHGTVVRSWARNTRLNGHEFVEAPLRAGDQLGIGPAVLEVVELGGPLGEHLHWNELFQRIDELQRQLDDPKNSIANPSQLDPQVADSEPIGLPSESLASESLASESLASELGELREVERTLRDELADCQRQLAAETTEREGLAQQFASFQEETQRGEEQSQSELAAELAENRDAATALREQIESIEQQLASEVTGRAELEQQLDDSRNSVDSTLQECEQLREQLAELHEKLAERDADVTSESDVDSSAQQESLDEITRQFEEALQQWESERDDWGRARSDLEQQLTELQSTIDAQNQELERTRQTLVKVQEHFEQQDEQEQQQVGEFSDDTASQLESLLADPSGETLPEDPYSSHLVDSDPEPNSEDVSEFTGEYTAENTADDIADYTADYTADEANAEKTLHEQVLDPYPDYDLNTADDGRSNTEDPSFAADSHDEGSAVAETDLGAQSVSEISGDSAGDDFASRFGEGASEDEAEKMLSQFLVEDDGDAASEDYDLSAYTDSHAAEDNVGSYSVSEEQHDSTFDSTPDEASIDEPYSPEVPDAAADGAHDESHNNEHYDGRYDADSGDVDNELDDGESVFSRLQAAGIWRDEQENDESELAADESQVADSTGAEDGVYQPMGADTTDLNSEDSGESSYVGQTSTPPAAPSSAPTGNEDDIDSYMQRLLARHRDGEDLLDDTEVAAEAAPLEQPNPEPAEPTVITEEEYRPRSAAPELSANLVAMRELANENADSAIDTFTRRNQAEHNNAQLKTAGFLAAIGTVSLVFVSRFIPTIGVVGGVGALIGAAYIGFKAFAKAAKLRPEDEQRTPV